MSKHLFIGGPVDGQRLESDPSATFWRIPVYTDLPLFSATTAVPKPEECCAGFSYHEYIQMQLMSQTVYVSSELDVVGTLDLLVRRYPDPAANNELKRAVRDLIDMLPDMLRNRFTVASLHSTLNRLLQLIS